jgi:cyclase
VEELLKCGADKVSINSAAINNPKLITDLANAFGSQCVVVAIDAKFNRLDWMVVSHSGTKGTIWNPFSWAKEAENLGAGEILLTSYSSDGTQQGFAIDLTSKISGSLCIPVIASGGAGCKEHFFEVFTEGKADAALAAGVFHFGKLTINEVKQYLSNKGIIIRL